jgi:hypothetical protein
MKIVACSGGFPTAWETLRRLLPEDEILVPPPEELADWALEADVLVPAMGRVTAELMGPRSRASISKRRRAARSPSPTCPGKGPATRRPSRRSRSTT